MIILGIETSCDETAASVVEGRQGLVTVLSNVVSSQIEIHKKYGGVVPEVAAREHVLNILPVIQEALTNADITRTYTEKKQSARVRGIDAIAVTVGPGLVTSLSVGVETAKSLAYAWKLPVVAVNHIESHLYSNFIDRGKIEFPALVLTVSGGHTILVLMSGHGEYKIIGETRDDAAGEAFDKAASLLGLGYPGGPAIAREAERLKSGIRNPKSEINSKFKIQNSKFGVKLPRPMLESGDFDFSFSGLKTALLYKLQKDKNWQKHRAEYAYEFQCAVVETLVGKTIKAVKRHGVKSVMLAGGVAANYALRAGLKEAMEKLNIDFLMPDLKYTTDNAAMVATAGYFKAQRKEYTPWHRLAVRVNLELS